MKAPGIVIWSQSNCRSTMALYRELVKELGKPALITLWHFSKDEKFKDIREQIGFSHDEFADLPILPVGENLEVGLKVLDQHPHWAHLFCVWQGSPVYRRLIVEAKRRGLFVGVMCESPCNMASGFRKVAKELYMRLGLPFVARKVVRSADFFVNDSGGDARAARRIGWREDQIIPFGYFSPPIPGSHFVKREGNKPFHILATGVLSRYRGADVLVDALRILKTRGVPFEATITQRGEMYKLLKSRAERWALPVDFPGFVEMPELIRLYETCAVYVGAGRSEPWGMRLNDALNCGAPLVVSRGMGGVKMVDDFGCGLSFHAGDAEALADALHRLATESETYERCANNVVVAARECSPAARAKELITALRSRI